MISRWWRFGLCLVLLGLQMPVEAAAPGRLGGGGDLSISVWRIMAGLFVCTIVAFVAVLVVRRRVAGGSGSGGSRGGAAWLGRFPRRVRRIDVVETRRLSPHADISLVRQGDREYLLLLFAGGSRLLRVGPAEILMDDQQ